MKAAVRWFVLAVVVLTGHGQTLSNGKVWQYQLTDGAAIMNDCPVCDRVSIWEPLRGSFDLIGTAVAGQYIVTNINFRTVSGIDRSVYGTGTLRYTGAHPTLTLDALIFLFDAGEHVRMTNTAPEDPRIFPMIGANVNEDTSSQSRVYRLRIQAAPIRELWFSTTTNFTGGSLGAISHGDLLSMNPRVVKRNAELTERLSIPEGDVGLDAVDVGPRGEIFFSTTANVESAVNGTITHSDIVTSEGRLYLQGSQLLSAFDVDDADAGLDALHLAANDEIYFSITKDIPRAGASTLHRGDILSNTGRIVRTEANLYLRWNLPAGFSAGVDAIYVWPNGEIWFSPGNAFTNTAGISVSAGDIISDQGYIAYRNAALVNAFAPTEQNADFGLDALVIVTDTAASRVDTSFVDIAVNENGVDLRWESGARFFQLERGLKVEGPYGPITDVIVDRAAHDGPGRPTAFYRLRQW
jgi:hypothetical protein